MGFAILLIVCLAPTYRDNRKGSLTPAKGNHQALIQYSALAIDESKKIGAGAFGKVYKSMNEWQQCLLLHSINLIILSFFFI
jgi:hypothetical protein